MFLLSVFWIGFVAAQTEPEVMVTFEMPTGSMAPEPIGFTGSLAPEPIGFTGSMPPMPGTEFPMAGGWSNANASDPEFLGLAWNATEAVNADASLAGSKQLWIPVKVDSAKEQVVAGMNYELVVDFMQSTCPKSTPNPTPIKCKVDVGSTKTMDYKIEIYVVPWTGEFNVTSVQYLPGFQ